MRKSNALVVPGDWRVWIVFLLALAAGGGIYIFSPRSQSPVEGTRWDGALDLPAPQAATAWTQIGRDASHLAQVDGLGPLKGMVVWKVKTGGPIISSPVAGAGVVYAGSSDGLLYAIDSQRGQVLWRFSLGAKLVNSTPVLAGGLLLVAGDYTWLNAVDVRTGRLVWRYDTGDNILAPPAADPQRLLAFVTNGHMLFALGLMDGHRRWQVQLSDDTARGWPSVAAPAVRSGRVFWAPGVGTHVLALDEADSKLAWSFDAGDRLASTLAVTGDTVYVPTWTGHLIALDSSTGAVRWQERLGSGETGQGTESSPAVELNRLFVGSYQGILYAVDTESGKALWQFRTGGPILSTPAVSGGIAYIPSADGRLYAVDASSGHERWNVTLAEMRGSPALADEGLYIGTLDGELAKIQ